MRITRFLPLAVLVAVTAAILLLGLDHYLSLDALRENRQVLQDFVADHRIGAALAYVAAYAAVVALSLPGATVMTLAGGFLFGWAMGGTLAVLAATLGAALVFLIARSTVGDALRNRAGPFLRRMEDGFRTNAFHYLLFLRLVPAFPFWAVNLAPALLGMPLVPFVAATAIGIIPGTLVFAAFGAGLGDLFAAGTEIRLAEVLSPTLIAALAGLGLLALLPVAVRKWRERRQ
ncbi:MAG: TVP38/TMEM64 family protein [Magnetospirillum sp.]|nr:TVP38/TMEM64 family protein [Magnetospirillum sp.]